MANFTPAGGGGVPVTANVAGASNPTILNVSLPTANTEVAIPLPNATRKYMLKLRSGTATLKLAFILGDSSLTYVTLHPGCVYTEESITTTGTTLYVQSPSAGEMVELVVWT